jgi:Tetratricopeptide repeat
LSPTQVQYRPSLSPRPRAQDPSPRPQKSGRVGRLDEARDIGEQVLQLKRRVLGDTYPSTIESMRDLGETLKRLGDTERALELLTRAFDLQVRTDRGLEFDESNTKP